MTRDTILNGLTTDALNKVHTLLNAGGPALASTSALDMYLWLARLEKWAAVTKANIKPEANAGFAMLKASQPDMKSWQPLPFVILRTQPEGTSYRYPKDILDMEAKLKAAKEAAKTAKQAKKITTSLDPATDSMFKVALQLC